MDTSEKNSIRCFKGNHKNFKCLSIGNTLGIHAPRHFYNSKLLILELLEDLGCG